MPNIFCPSCGASTKYLYTKPANCPSCKHSFAARISNIELPEEKPVKLEESNAKTIISITPLKKITPPKEIGVSVDTPVFEKLGEVIGSNPGEQRVRRKGVSKKDFKDKVFKSEPTEVTDA